MPSKTISGHIGPQYSIEHNLRSRMPPNADPSRSFNNIYLVAAGAPLADGFPNYEGLSELWADYRELVDAFWAGRAIRRELIWETEQHIHRSHWYLQRLFGTSLDNPIALLVNLLIFPYLLLAELICDAYSRETIRMLQELGPGNEAQIRGELVDLRKTLLAKDRQAGTELVARLDQLALRSKNLAVEMEDHGCVRFATLEEIYNHLFEPAFQAYQSSIRPNRRVDCTYLEDLRRKKAKHIDKYGVKESTRCPAEALEIVFQIGEMKDTGYAFAPEDAAKAEDLLQDFCCHLLADPNVCVITSDCLRDPNWQPPFKNGLLICNLVTHFDEATPGVHMTFIPYSRDCSRGTAVQASLSRAFCGMGYPSTWEEVLDESGNPIPKRDKNGLMIFNKDGTVRTKKVPSGKGAIDWIEEQKRWLEKEMKERYDWDRAHKGSHPGGYRATPQYKLDKTLEEEAEVRARIVQNQAAIAEQEQVLFGLQRSWDRLMDEIRVESEKMSDRCEDQEDWQLLQRFYETAPDDELAAVMQAVVRVLQRQGQDRHVALERLLTEAEQRKKQAKVAQQDAELKR